MWVIIENDEHMVLNVIFEKISAKWQEERLNPQIARRFINLLFFSVF